MDDGFNAMALFLILREDVFEFSPNKTMDPDFSEALIKSHEKGVLITAYSFKNIFKNNSLHIEPFKRINIRLAL